jgi:hypothetical protein
LPLSRCIFFVNSSPPAAATVFVTDPLFPVKHLFEFFSPGAKFRKGIIHKHYKHIATKKKPSLQGLTPRGRLPTRPQRSTFLY